MPGFTWADISKTGAPQTLLPPPPSLPNLRPTGGIIPTINPSAVGGGAATLPAFMPPPSIAPTLPPPPSIVPAANAPIISPNVIPGTGTTYFYPENQAPLSPPTGAPVGIPAMPGGVNITGGPITGPVTGNVPPPQVGPPPTGIPGGQQTNIYNAIPGENITIAQMQASNALDLQSMRDTVQRETIASQEKIATLDRQLQEKQVLANIANQAGNLALAQQHEADASNLAWQRFREEQRVYGLNDEFRKREFELTQEIQRAQVSQGQQGQNLQRAGFLANLLANPPTMLQNARTLTPELVNYIEGGNTPFQWLLENRTLRPGAPGGY